MNERWKVTSVKVSERGFSLTMLRRSFSISSWGESRKGPSKISLDSGVQIASFLHSLLLLRLFSDKGSWAGCVEDVCSLARNGVSATTSSLEETVQKFTTHLDSVDLVFRMKGELGNLIVQYSSGMRPRLELRGLKTQGSFPLLLLPQCCVLVGGNWFEFQPVIADGSRLPRVLVFISTHMHKIVSFIVEHWGAEGLKRFCSNYVPESLDRVVRLIRRSQGV